MTFLDWEEKTFQNFNGCSGCYKSLLVDNLIKGFNMQLTTMNGTIMCSLTFAVFEFQASPQSKPNWPHTIQPVPLPIKNQAVKCNRNIKKSFSRLK